MHLLLTMLLVTLFAHLRLLPPFFIALPIILPIVMMKCVFLEALLTSKLQLLVWKVLRHRLWSLIAKEDTMSMTSNWA